MTQLVDQLKVCLASTFAFYLKAHQFHWNVEGPNFAQYHAFLGDLYNEVWGSVDTIAEHIRILDAYAPGGLRRFASLSVLEDQLNIPTAISMIRELHADNNKLIEILKTTNEMAEKEGEIGLANFIQERIDVHSKHSWMLRSIGKQ